MDTRFRTVDISGGRKARIAPESDEGRGGSSTTVVRTRLIGQMPFDDMRNRGQINASQYGAAERMHSNYVRGGLVPVKAQNLIRVDCGNGVTPESVVQAKEAYFRDLELLEPRGASVVHWVCGEGVTCTAWAKRMKVTVQYATERFREALDTIAEKHGL